MRDGYYCGFSAMNFYCVVIRMRRRNIQRARCLVEEQEPRPQEKYLGKEQSLLLTS